MSSKSSKSKASKEDKEKSVAKRHKHAPEKPTIMGFNKPAFKRLCHRGGAKRVGETSSIAANKLLMEKMTPTISDAVLLALNAGRVTVLPEDVAAATKRRGKETIGF